MKSRDELRNAAAADEFDNTVESTEIYGNNFEEHLYYQHLKKQLNSLNPKAKLVAVNEFSSMVGLPPT